MPGHDVSGDLPQPAAVVGAQSSLRVYSTYRYHGFGSPTLKVHDVRTAHDHPAAPYIGVRLALHQSGTQTGPTLVFNNENGVTKSFGWLGPGLYAMQGRTVRLSNSGGFSDPPITYWSGYLTLGA